MASEAELDPGMGAPAAPASASSQVRSESRAGASRSVSLVNAIPSRRLDFLRGVAALYVLLNHSRGRLFAGGQILHTTKPLEWYDYIHLALLQATSLGTEAVILFFVLSGFAMAHSVRYAQSVRTFYFNRALRIWPAYLLALTLAFAIAYFILHSPGTTVVKSDVSTNGWGLSDFVSRAFYTDVETVLTAQFWSLPQEVLFYILCPFLLASLFRVRLFWLISVALTVGGALMFGIYKDPTVGGGLLYEHFFTLLIFFMTGAMAYYYQDLIPRVSPIRLTVGAGLYAIILWALKYHVFDGWNLVTSLLTAPLAVMLLGNVPAKVYDVRWLNWGKFSYSIYLFHLQLIILIAYLFGQYAGINQSDMTSYWGWTLAIPPILLVCWLFYLVGERPCSDLLAKRREQERERERQRPEGSEAPRSRVAN